MSDLTAFVQTRDFWLWFIGACTALGGFFGWFSGNPRAADQLYALSRFLLKLSVPVYAYCLFLLALIFSPWSWWALVVFALPLFAKKGRRGHALSAHGTARWATEDDLRRAGMVNGRGLILGRLLGGEGSRDNAITPVEAAVEGVKAFAKLMAWGMENSVFTPGFQHFAEHGAHELANALFNGNGPGTGYVMYPKAEQENALHGPEQERQQVERGGLGM